MRLAHIQKELYHRPLLITQDGFQTIHSLVQHKLKGNVMPMDDMEDEEQEYDDVVLRDGVAYINVQGVIGRKLSFIEKACTGACDVEDLRDNIELAASYPDVAHIALVIDSPGGTVAGVPELAQRIKEINDTIKPVTAIVDGLCCSAAYYLAAGCDSILAIGKTSYIGSIGVYTYLLDESQYFAKEGVQPVVIKAGLNKGEGLPGMPITDEIKANLQKEVDYIYNLFTTHVKGNRPNVEDDTMQGRAYYSEEAEKLGLIDGYVNTINEIFTN